ncbi:WW domain-containing protein [Quillaja saponaria]|uniref:WW domain-containing protein n=1 Tax=Quillaja saponaria TaxID=32244 RepID=A0AAD7LIY9_QUISA|nr:WW domain-containing protein [Quillaja saponaria]
MPLHSESPEKRKDVTEYEIISSSKKRKWEVSLAEEETCEELSKAENKKSIFDMELHLETPLPSEWQQCLNIQSGKLHFYNTRTHKKTSKDPRSSPDELSTPEHISLDLELNLTCESQARNDADNNSKKQDSPTSLGDAGLFMMSSRYKKDSGGFNRCPSWLSIERDDHQEMVATVCMKCHMLVMLCKSSPACPNCKFMHPPDQNPPTLLKRRCSLLC